MTYRQAVLEVFGERLSSEQAARAFLEETDGEGVRSRLNLIVNTYEGSRKPQYARER